MRAWACGAPPRLRLDARVVFLAAVAAAVAAAAAECPLGFGTRGAARRELLASDRHASQRLAASAGGVGEPLDLQAVKADLKTLFVSSQDFWPADNGHYGPLMVRLAWHCSGSYRSSDGRGGCDGARQRFEPERSWDDNTNLDKARKLLWPIKEKYGSELSWGDLLILAGTTAIEAMGGPVLGFCGGRIDDVDGSASLPLGPTPEQEALAPCPVQGDCPSPLGQNTLGLIYVNPEGPQGKPLPEQSAAQIREVFGRMNMDDAETVALIGGGHAFGKAHGACRTGPGPSPKDSPADPWPGTCGSGPMKGKGPNTFTAGFEGPWSTTPTRWGNNYFQNLLEYDWKVEVSPGGHHQWAPVSKHPKDKDAPPPPRVMMLTTDVALLHDTAYLELVKLYASNLTALEDVFSHAWYKLVSRDMGPASRCTGPLVPPPQPFQAPLPPGPAAPPPPHHYANAALELRRSLGIASDILEGDIVDGEPYYGALFATLAYECAASFRATDYAGGCNGARIRFAPQKDWPGNKGLDKVIDLVVDTEQNIKGPNVSLADLIVLGGAVAIEDAAGIPLTASFCGGRMDAPPDEPPLPLPPPRELADKVLQFRDNAAVRGLSLRHAVALQARLRSRAHQRTLGYSGSWTTDPSTLSNEYFKVLLRESWSQGTSSRGQVEYSAVGRSEVYMLPLDVALLWDAELTAIAQEFAGDAAAWQQAFIEGWTYLVNADRFDGPHRNLCHAPPAPEVTAGAEAGSATGG